VTDETLAEVRRLRTRTRERAHGGAWLPAAVLAALVLLSGLLYRFPFSVADESGPWPYWPGLPSVPRSSALSYAYWLVGLPAAFAVAVVWYRYRARRLGVRVAWPVLVTVGLAAFVLMLALVAIPRELPPDPNAFAGSEPPLWHGFATPLVAVAASLVALGRVERSPGLAVAGLWLGGFSFLANAEGFLGRIPGWLDWILAGGEGPGIGGGIDTGAVPALVFLTLPLLIWLCAKGVRSALR